MPTGRWSPPTDDDAAAQLRRVRRERDKLAATCRELLAGADVADELKEKLDDAVAQCG